MIEYNSPIGKIRSGEFDCTMSYYDVADKLMIPHTSQPIVCVRNGFPVLRKDWNNPIGLNQNEITFIQIPRGQSIKNIIKTIALIALSVAAPGIGTLVGGGILGGLASAAFVLGGAFLLNVLFPPPKVDKQSTNTASPTYSLGSSGNQARLLGPIPRTYGTMKMTPDFASQPFNSFESNEQYLYELFCLGVGDYEVDTIYISQTVLWDNVNGLSESFADVEIEIIPPGQALTLFPSDVITSSEVSGQELRYETFTEKGTFSGSRFTLTGTSKVIEFLNPGDTLIITGTGVNDGAFVLSDTDSVNKAWVDFGSHIFTTQANVTASFTLNNWVGPFVANPNDRGTNQIKVDVVLPRGLYYAADDGSLSNASVSFQVQVRLIDNEENPIGDYISVYNETITLQTVTPQRFTRTIDLGLARYEVRMQRTNTRQHDTRYGDELDWQALRAFIPDDNIFDDVTLLAMKIRASNQLSSQSSTEISVIQKGKIPVWNNTTKTWSSPQVTSNPAWVAADVLRNTVYGASMADSRIDIAKLYQLSLTYDSRGDSFNAVFDTSQTLWDALAQVLTAVRSQPILIAGMVTFIRDEPRALARTVITPQSMLKNTFEMQHTLQGQDSADDVIVEFMDSVTWTQSEVQCILPGSTSQNPARIQLFGVTNISQAWREGMYYAATNTYRRVTATTSTEADGRLLIKGDSVIVSHDIPQWSQNGFVMDYIEAERTLVFDRNVKFSTVSGLSYIILRRKDGKEFGPIIVTSNGYGNEAILDSGSLLATQTAQGITIDQVLSIDDEAKTTTFVFIAAGSFVKKFIVTSATMRGMTQVDLGLVVDDSRVYTADSGTPPAGVSYLGPPVTLNGPVASGLRVVQDPTSGSDPVKLNISWAGAAGATSYILQYSPNLGVSWQNIYTGAATAFAATLNAGVVYVRVAAVGTILGPWAYTTPITVTFGTPTLIPGLVSNLVVTADVAAGVIEADFNAAPRATSYRADVVIESSTGSGNFNTVKLSKTSTSTSISWTSAEITAVGGPWSRILINIYSINVNGMSTAVSQAATGISLGIITGLALNATYRGVEASILWNAVASATLYRIKIYNPSGVLVRETTTTSTSYFYSNSQLITDGGPWRTFTVSVNAEASALIGTAATLGVSDPAPVFPSTITSSSTNTGEVVINWNAVVDSDITGYIVYGSNTTGFTADTAHVVYTGTALTTTITGLTSGSTYYFRVATTDGYAGNNGYNISTENSRTVF